MTQDGRGTMRTVVSCRRRPRQTDQNFAPLQFFRNARFGCGCSTPRRPATTPMTVHNGVDLETGPSHSFPESTSGARIIDTRCASALGNPTR